MGQSDQAFRSHGYLNIIVEKMKEEHKTVKVFSGTELEVNLLQDELSQMGVFGRSQNDNNSGVMAGFFGGGPFAVDFFIYESDFKKAEPLIKAFSQRNK